MAEYHEADNAFQSFRIANLLGIIAEDEAEAEALNDKRNEALRLLIEYADGYAGLKAKVERLTFDCSVLNGQHVAADSFPTSSASSPKKRLNTRAPLRPSLKWAVTDWRPWVARTTPRLSGS